MAEHDTPPPEVDPYWVARIVGSYVRHHQIGPDQLVGLIAECIERSPVPGMRHPCKNR